MYLYAFVYFIYLLSSILCVDSFVYVLIPSDTHTCCYIPYANKTICSHFSPARWYYSWNLDGTKRYTHPAHIGFSITNGDPAFCGANSTNRSVKVDPWEIRMDHWWRGCLGFFAFTYQLLIYYSRKPDSPYFGGCQKPVTVGKDSKSFWWRAPLWPWSTGFSSV